MLAVVALVAAAAWVVTLANDQTPDRAATTTFEPLPSTTELPAPTSSTIAQIQTTFSENRASGSSDKPYQVPPARGAPSAARPATWSWPTWPLVDDVTPAYPGDPTLGLLLGSWKGAGSLPFGGRVEQAGDSVLITPTSPLGVGSFGSSPDSVAAVVEFDLGTNPAQESAIGLGCQRSEWGAELVVSGDNRWRLLAGAMDDKRQLDATPLSGEAVLPAGRSTLSMTCTTTAVGIDQIDTELVGRLDDVEILRVTARTPFAMARWEGRVNGYGSAPILVGGYALHDPLQPPMAPGPVEFVPGPTVIDDRFPDQGQRWLDANAPNVDPSQGFVEVKAEGFYFLPDEVSWNLPIHAPGEPIDGRGVVVGVDLGVWSAPDGTPLPSSGGAGCALFSADAPELFSFAVGGDGLWELRDGGEPVSSGVDDRLSSGWVGPRRVDLACTVDRGSRERVEAGRDVLLHVVAFIDGRAVADHVATRSGAFPGTRWVPVLAGPMGGEALIAGLQAAPIS